MSKTKKSDRRLIDGIFILVFLLSAIIYINSTYAFNLPEPRNCSACHASDNGNFAEQPVDLTTSCAVCHFSLISQCNTGLVASDYGMFKTIPPIVDGVILHTKHSGVNLRANDPACEKCHFQVDCSTCHITHHDQHSATNPDNSPKGLLVTDGNTKHSTNIYCANSPCHATVQNSLDSESSVLLIKNGIINNTIKTGNDPKGIAINLNTKRIYTANYTGNTVSVINIDSTSLNDYNTVIDTINVGNNPYDVAVNKNNNFIYVTNTNDNSVTIINGNDNSIFGTVTVGQNPRDIAVNETTNEVYVLNYGEDSITSLDSNGNTITTISQNYGGIRQRGIAIDEIRNKIYAGIFYYEPGPEGIKQYDIAVISNDTLIGSIQNVGGIIYSMAINEITERLYIGSLGKIIVINTADGSSGVVANIDLGATDAVVIDIKVSNNIVYAITRNNEGNGNLYIINENTLDITETIPIGKYSERIEKDETTGVYYITNGTSILVPEPKPSCYNCHTFGVFGSHVATNHEPNPIHTANETCNLCHSETYLTRLHINDGTNYDCFTCHAGKGSNYGSTALRIIQEYKISPRGPDYKAGCPDCHPNVKGDKYLPDTLKNNAHISLHEPYSSTSIPCIDCHVDTNLPAIHKGLPNSCIVCHSSYARLEAQNAIAKYKQEKIKAGCKDCHETIDHTTLHVPNPDTSVACTAAECHGNNFLPIIHEPNNCFLCHGTGVRQEVQDAILNYKSSNTMAGCNDCHPNKNHTALHTSNPSASYPCVTCHIDTIVDPEKRYLPNIHTIEGQDDISTSCSRCHSSMDSTVQSAILKYKNDPNKDDASKAGCKDCHSSIDHVSLRIPNSNTSSPCVNCHMNTLPDIHTENPDLYTSCDKCHASTRIDVQNAILNYKNNKIFAGCNDCHENIDHLTLHDPNPDTSMACLSCHKNDENRNLPEIHTKDINPYVSCALCHASTRSDVQNAISNYKNGGPLAGCNDCHSQVSHTCVTCHENQRNGRKPITPEFGLNSHHVKGFVTPDDCMDCHDVSRHGQGTVYLKNADGGSIIAYDSNNTSSATPFCLGCHDSDSKNSEPFSDGKKPISSSVNWDTTDIDTKYSNTGTADSNKYPPTEIPDGLSGKGWKYNTVPNEKKAYSPHGNPSSNEPNGNALDKPVACLDCHNSHGSSLPSIIKTTPTYTPASIEDFCWDCHLNAQNAPYKASAYLKDPGNNTVRDYYGDSRWGENDGTGFKGDWIGTFTFKNGRFMSSHFFPSKTYDSSSTWSRSSVKCTDCHDPHGINSAKTNAEYMVPILKGTWLVSPFKEDRPPMTSFESQMPETVREGEESNYRNGVKPRSRPDLDFNNPPDPGAGYADSTGGHGHEGYFIEENTLGAYGTYANHDSNGSITINRIAEDDTKFAGLCLRCHTQTKLKSAWGGHGVVKGWGGASKDIFTSSIANNTQNEGEEGSDNFSWGVKLRSQQSSGYIQKDYHQFTCSKCHSPHASRLKRLMITNCLDTKGEHSEFSDMLRDGATNCHSTSRGNGWNNETPWMLSAIPGAVGTVENAILSPATSNILAGVNQTMTFTAKNIKGYKLKYYYVELSYNYSDLNITNFVCSPAPHKKEINTSEKRIVMEWENVDPRVILMATFDCRSNNSGIYRITKNKIEYEDNDDHRYNGNCNEAVININITQPDTQAPSIPSNLTGTAVSKSQINLIWSASTDNVGVKGYYVYKNGTKIGTIANTSYSITGLSSSTYYKFKVSAYDVAGNESGFSTEITVKTRSY